MPTLKILILLWICDRVHSQVPTDMSNLTNSSGFLDVSPDFSTTPPHTEDKSAALTVAALGVISFVVILVVIVIILVSVVSLRFKCRHCKDAEDKQKPQHAMVTYSCSDAEAPAVKKNVMLVSMKDLNASNRNSQGVAKAIITHIE